MIDQFIITLYYFDFKEALERLNGHAAYQDNGSQNSPDHLQNSPNSDVTTFPAFQSLMEMGYSQPTIQRAFDILKDTKGSKCVHRIRILYF